MAKQFFKSPANVRFYWGTPQENTSGVPFEEAQIIWQDKATDWHKAINTIIVDPDAGHFYRNTDQIPFRMEQIRLYPEEVEELISLRSQGVIKWHFESFNQLWKIPPENVKQLQKRARNATGQIPPYVVPLSTQAVIIIQELLRFKYKGQCYSLTHRNHPEQYISENTLNSGLKRMGYKNKLTGHGIRATLEDVAVVYILTLEERHLG